MVNRDAEICDRIDWRIGHECFHATCGFDDNLGTTIATGTLLRDTIGVSAAGVFFARVLLLDIRLLLAA